MLKVSLTLPGFLLEEWKCSQSIFVKGHQEEKCPRSNSARYNLFLLLEDFSASTYMCRCSVKLMRSCTDTFKDSSNFFGDFFLGKLPPLSPMFPEKLHLVHFRRGICSWLPPVLNRMLVLSWPEVKGAVFSSYSRKCLRQSPL